MAKEWCALALIAPAAITNNASNLRNVTRTPCNQFLVIAKQSKSRNEGCRNSTPAPCGAQNGSAIGVQWRLSLWRCPDGQQTRGERGGRRSRARPAPQLPASRVALVRSGQGFGEMRELALPGTLGLLLVVGLRV